MFGFSTWLRNTFRRCLRTPRRACPRGKPVPRPMLELLEDRTLPSTIWYVNASATGGNGQSWANAFTDLQAALAVAQPGDQVWVAQGTYTPTGTTDRSASFALKDGVALFGDFGGTETQLSQRDFVHHATTLSGDIGAPGDSSDNSFHVVTATGLSATAVLDGFTITAGNANGSAVLDLAGGGLLNDSSSLTLTNVTFSGNFASVDGGGLCNIDGSSPTLTNVTFSGNFVGQLGGGLCNVGGSPTLTNVTFFSNFASIHGGGLCNVGSSPTLTNVTFSGNFATQGGGLYNEEASSPTLTNVTFSNNTATLNGGGLYNEEASSPTLTDVTFSGNFATQGGALFNNDDSQPTLANVTFSSNFAIQGGALFNSNGSKATLTNCILWQDSSQEIVNDTISQVTVNHSDVQGGLNAPGIIDAGNNLSLDPLFVDPFHGDLHLMSGSPAIDTGTNSGAPTFDLDNNPRPVEGGTGPGAITDMGAYEFQLPPDNDLGVDAGQHFTLDDSAGAGASVGTVTASDPDDPGVTFSGWTITDKQTPFALDPSTGKITVLDPTELDGHTSYALHVTVSDGTVTSAPQTVSIALTDHDLAITPGQTFTLDEAAGNGSLVGTVTARDADDLNAHFSAWTVSGGTGQGSFAIDPATGQVTLSDSSRLKNATSFTLLLTTSDGLFSSAPQSVTIQLNHAPVLHPLRPTLQPLIANQTSAASNPGQTVASFLGKSISDLDSGALQGIAITAALVLGPGSWQFNTGSGWHALGSVSVTSALLLRATDRIRFLPDGLHAASASLTYLAWDQTGGTAGLQGTKVNARTLTQRFGSSGPFSTAADTAAIAVTAFGVLGRSHGLRI